MKLITKFNLNDKVKIKELEKVGHVKSIYLTNLGLSYNIRYFNNNTPQEVYFYESELESYKEKGASIGF